MASTTYEETLFEALTEDSETAGGLDEAAQEAEPGNFLRHVGSLSMTKTADGLIDPKLVLSWLLNALGAPAVLVGLLVPIREAGALLPQLFTAPRIRAMARRKWAWAGGSLVQGLAALAIVAAALTLSGWAAGIAVVVLLGVLAVARSVCSVSYKDVLGKTVGQARRGTATGLASSAAAVAVVVFAVILLVDLAPRMGVVIAAISLAGLLWLVAAGIFATLSEQPTPGEPDGVSLGRMTLLWERPQLGRFVAARALLVGTALAPPYLVLLGAGTAETFEALGALVLASSAASFVSSYVWGRLADRSSRRVLILSGLMGAAALGLSLIFAATGLAATGWALPVALFALMIAYHGVRQGRSTYLVDMAPAEARATYTAVSNTAIGLLLMGAGVFGALAAMAGPEVTVVIFAVMCLAGAAVATRLDEVEDG